MMRTIPLIVLLALLAGAPARAGDAIYYRTDENGVIILTNVPDRKELRAYPGLGPMKGIRSGAAFRDVITRTANRYGVQPDLVYAVISIESNFDQFALSRKGAQGLMQLMPATAQQLGVSDPFDAADNVDGGVRYLRYLLDKFGGDTRLALAAYNAGETVVLARGDVPPYRETRNYVRRILTRFGRTRTPYTDR